MKDRALHDQIRARHDAITDRFRDELEQQRHSAGRLAPSPLVDALPEFFERLWVELDHQEGGSLLDMALPAAEAHGRSRWRQGFDLREVVREYGILQHVIMKDLLEHGFEPTQRELHALHNAINSGIAQAVVGFCEQKEELQKELAERDRQLRSQQQRLGLVTRHVPQILWTADPTGRIDWYNDRFFEYTGRTRIETGREWLEMAHQDDQSRVAAGWRTATTTAQSFAMEFRLGNRCGEYRWHLVRASPVRDEAGQIAQWFGTCTDVDDHKRHEAQLEAATAEAERLNALKDEFLATVSHELRTPLQAILGWASLLSSQQLDEKAVVRATRAIERNAKAQARLISEILDLSRIITGRATLETRPVVLGPLIAEAIEAVGPAASAKGLLLQATVEDDLGTIVADSDSLRRVMWNLLSNAVKFTPPGGAVSLVARIVEHDAEIVVEDTGQGIDAEFLPFLFEPFRQAEAGPSRKHEGLGLGLAIVRHLVQQHGGTVVAESLGPGQGARFRVALPRRAARASASTQQTLTRTASEPGVPAINALTGVRALLVDDEDDSRELIRTILSQYGAWVRDAATTAEALSLLETERFDVMVSDIAMPLEDGYALIRRIRALHDKPKVSAIPAIALTAYARQSDCSKALRSGYDRHVAKPVQPAKLVSEVVRLTQPLTSE